MVRMMTAVAAAAAMGVASALPVPSAGLLRWLDDEVTGMGSYNMGTYEACGIGAVMFEGNAHTRKEEYITLPKGSTFDPTNLDVEQWILALKSAGVKHAVLTLSHGCGYTLYPSKAAFPQFNFTYDYGIRQSPYKGGQGDIAREFVDACRKHGIGPGFYNGAVNNAYLNVVGGVAKQKKVYEGQVILTQDQYIEVLLANLRQIWTDYGELAEVWFDGGYPEGSHDKIVALLKELQPTAAVFNGPVGYENSIRWIGTESGHPKYPVWSTADSSLDSGSGSPDGKAFVPAEADTCFQKSAGQNAEAPYGGCWFYNPNMVPKSLSDLQSTYQDTVGSNSALMIDWSPRPAGDLPESHLQRYKEFGDWVAECYNSSKAEGGKLVRGNNVFGFAAGASGASYDRVVMMEHMAGIGQSARVYTVTNRATGHVLATGSSIGHKRVAKFNTPVSAADLANVVVNVTWAVPSTMTVEAYGCDGK